MEYNSRRANAMEFEQWMKESMLANNAVSMGLTSPDSISINTVAFPKGRGHRAARQALLDSYIFRPSGGELTDAEKLEQMNMSNVVQNIDSRLYGTRAPSDSENTPEPNVVEPEATNSTEASPVESLVVTGEEATVEPPEIVNPDTAFLRYLSNSTLTDITYNSPLAEITDSNGRPFLNYALTKNPNGDIIILANTDTNGYSVPTGINADEMRLIGQSLSGQLTFDLIKSKLDGI